MDLLSTNKVGVTRTKSGTGRIDKVTREWVTGEDKTTFSLSCSLQPLRQKDRHLVPDGIRTSDCYVILSRGELLEVDEHRNQEADVVNVDGLAYEVVDVQDWSRFSLTSGHYRCIIVRIDKLGIK